MYIESKGEVMERARAGTCGCKRFRGRKKWQIDSDEVRVIDSE